jgi:hypothetical protein
VSSEAWRRSWRRRLSKRGDVAPASVSFPRILAVPIDAVADAALARVRDDVAGVDRTCDACDEPIEGEPASRGVFLTTRGAEIRLDESALCGACAIAIGLKIKLEAEIEEES